MRLRSKPALVLVAVVATSCLPGGRLPEMAVKRGGSLDAAGRAPTSDRGPFRVSFAGPDGDDIEHPQPQLVFSRPVRALGQARDEPKIDARFSPAIAGRWEWVGTSAARFVPDGPFDQATTYTLEIAPGIRALDGQTLPQPVKLTFSTLRPTLNSIYPNAGEQEVSPTEIVRMHFSQVIPRSALEHGTRIVDRSGHDVPFVLEQDGDRWSQSVQLKPKGRWPEGERLTIKLASGILGTEGVLPMVPRDVTFDTLSHLHVVRIECDTIADGRCRDGVPIGVALSGDMRPSDLRRLLSIKPAVKLKPPSTPGDVSTSYHVLEGDFRAGVAYAITVDAAKTPPRQPPPRKPGEAAEVLRQLKLGATAELTFAPTPPIVELSFNGTYFPPSPAVEVAAKAEDTKRAMAGAVPLTRAKVIELASRTEQRPWWEWAGAKTAVLPVRATKKDPPGWLSLLPQTPVGAGPVVFGTRWDGLGGAEESSTQVLQRSDLALHARVSPEGTLAWVTSLTTGRPIEGAKVEARDGAQHSVSAITDKDGVALLATTGVGTKPEKGDDDWRTPSPWMVLFVERGDDWIYQRVETPAKAPLRGALFTDRGLYRPGETAHLKGVVREPTSKGLIPVQGREVIIETFNTKGNTVRGKATLSAWGTFDHAVALPADAPLGTYTAKVLIDDVRVTYESFQVKEYRPSTFSVESRLASATDPARKIHKRGDKLVCSGHARYLYGGSLEGASATAYLSRQHASYQVPDLPGFTVEEDESKPTPAFPGSERRAKLDTAGHAEFPIALDNDGQWGPELVTCDVTVTDPSEELVAASSSVLVHPGDVYVALEDHRYRTLFPGQTLRPKVLAVTPDGKREVRPVHLELVQFVRNPKSSWSALPGKSVASCDVTTGADPQSCTLTAPQGSYDDTMSFIVRGSLVDARGPVSASVRYFPGKPPKIEPVTVKKKEKPRPAAKLEADKTSYAVGDVAHLLATSPFDASHMLFTVEREGVREHKVLPATKDPIAIDVAIDDGSAPGVHAVATFVAPFSDKTVHRRALGTSKELKSGWAHHRLLVDVRPSKALASPGEELDVDVDVHTRDGKPALAEVTLYAADEGTLALAKYHLPDPLDTFFRSPQHTVSTFHTRDDLASTTDWREELRTFGQGIGLGSIGTIGHGSGTGTGQGFGSGSGRLGGSGGRPEPRRNFEQSAFFLPSLTTDAAGHLRAHVKLPESLTTYKVMAFATTNRTDFGAAEAPVVTSMPLQVRPSLPRVIRVGDKFALGMMVANNGSTKLDTKVAIDVVGLDVAGPRERDLSLSPGESRRVTFDVDAKAPKKGKVTASIRAGVLVDSAELPFEVVVPLAMEAAALHGAAEGRVDEKLGDLRGVRDDVGSLDVSLSTSPLAGLAAGLDQLVQYPYGCTEQTTSRLVPLLPLRELARALDVSLPADLDRATKAAVTHLLQNQRPDGGFGLWPGSSAASDWLSVYATWGLEEAKRHNVPVDATAHKRARGRLLAMLASWGSSADAKVTAPYALDVLEGAAGEDDVDKDHLAIVADQLFDARAGMPLFSRALLLHAMGKLGTARARIDVLTAELTGGLHIDGPLARHVGSDVAHAGRFDSGVRTSAMLLRALLVVAPNHPMVTPLALGLVHDRNGGTWRTTQEAAWALLALEDYRRTHLARSGPLDAEVWLGGTQRFLHSFVARDGLVDADAHKTLPIGDVLKGAGQDLSFIGRGKAPLYYQAVLHFAPRDLPTDDLASGLEIHRRYYVVPNKLDDASARREAWRTEGTSFAEGATVLSEIEVITSSPRRYVVIDDPLPGGFESFDVTLQGGPRWLRRYEHRGSTRVERRDDRVLFFADDLPPGVHRFSHLVRVTRSGSFVTPPARTEEMYTPETFGRTAARVVVVR